MFFDAIMKWKKGGALQESLDMMLEALHCTVPAFGDRDMKWWVFQREEIMIAGDIADLYNRLGRPEETKKWNEAILFSVEQNSARTGTLTFGYDIVALGYSDYLGNIHDFDYAAELCETVAGKLLRSYRINCIQHLFYHITWNLYEAASKMPEKTEYFRQKWRKAFRISKIMAEYIYDTHESIFLGERERKYLA